MRRLLAATELGVFGVDPQRAWRRTAHCRSGATSTFSFLSGLGCLYLYERVVNGSARPSGSAALSTVERGHRLWAAAFFLR